MSTVRKAVCRSVISAMAWIDGSSPPGKMYFWIQVCVLRLASIRSCGMVIAWIATRPPGRTSRSSVAKYSRPRVVSHRLDHLDGHHCVVAAFDVAVVAQVDLQPDRTGPPRRPDAAPAAAARPTGSPSGRALRGRPRGCTARPIRCRSRGPGCRAGLRPCRAADRSCVVAPQPDRATRWRAAGRTARDEYVMVSSRNSANRSLDRS